MTTQWLILVAGIPLVVTIALLIASYVKVNRQNFLIRLQSNEIEKQIRELIQQNQQGEELNREKKQLVMLVSHDLKGPFNRIFALMQLLEMSADNFTPDQKELFGKMHQIVGDGLNMVRNLVDVRKIEERGVDPHPEKVNVINSVAALVNQYRISAEKKRITLHLKIPERFDFITDKNYLSRITENLISNAIKFSANDTEVHVEVITTGNGIEISVQDQGPGLSDDDQLKLYQKFQKLTPRPTGGESSTGLGLAIIKQLVTSMGGDVTCTSVLEKGSKFVVKLPELELKPVATAMANQLKR